MTPHPPPLPSRPIPLLAAFATLALLGGCATGVDRAVFVTKTSISILDVDSTPPGVSVAYDRVEGFIGPAYESGGAPPVVGVLRSDGKVLNPKVKQLYATGNAARALTGEETKASEDELSGANKRLMFFGTSTNIGLKVGIDATSSGNFIPNNFVFGYRRKEYSLLPLGHEQPAGEGDKKIGTYPSVLAAIDNTGEAGADGVTGRPSAGLSVVQYFATGIAATKLVPNVKAAFIEEGQNAFGTYRKTLEAQRLLAGEILYCYAAVPISKRLAALRDANRLTLIPDSGDGAGFQDMKKHLADPSVYDATNNTVLKPDTVARIDGAYAHYLYPQADGFDASRTKLLEIHKAQVCALTQND